MHPAGSPRKDSFAYLPCLRPAEAAGAQHPGPRAQSRWWASSKGIVDPGGDYPQQVSPMPVYNVFGCDKSLDLPG